MWCKKKQSEKTDDNKEVLNVLKKCIDNGHYYKIPDAPRWVYFEPHPLAEPINYWSLDLKCIHCGYEKTVRLEGDLLASWGLWLETKRKINETT